METAFRIFMYLFPFAVSLSLYYWMLKRALKVPVALYRVLALVIISGGILYTLFKIVTSASGILTNDNFEFAIFIVTVAVLALAAITMALGEPEK